MPPCSSGARGASSVSRTGSQTCAARARAPTTVLPSGFVLWEWDADAEFGEAAGEKWLHLRPDKWNPSRPVVYGWRYDPREFAPGAAPARDARRRNATRVMDD